MLLCFLYLCDNLFSFLVILYLRAARADWWCCCGRSEHQLTCALPQNKTAEIHNIFYAFYNGYITLYITYSSKEIDWLDIAHSIMDHWIESWMLISEKPHFGHIHCKSNQNLPDESALQMLATISNLSIVNGRWDFQNWIHLYHSQELPERNLMPQERRNASTCFVWTLSA